MEERERIDKQELRSNAAVKFISHNANLGKWWHDPQIRKEDWRTTGAKLTRYILNNQTAVINQIRKHRENDPAKRAIDTIRRVLMQMNQCNRKTEMEPQILELQCFLAIQALEINKPTGDLKLLKEIMGTIESTYKESEEYLLLKAEILLEAKEWSQLTYIYNLLEKETNHLLNERLERIQGIQEKTKERKNKIRRNRLISCSNQISKDLFEKDEDINRVTQLILTENTRKQSTRHVKFGHLL
jgi:hypothetical protein